VNYDDQLVVIVIVHTLILITVTYGRHLPVTICSHVAPSPGRHKGLFRVVNRAFGLELHLD